MTESADVNLIRTLIEAGLPALVPAVLVGLYILVRLALDKGYGIKLGVDIRPPKPPTPA